MILQDKEVIKLIDDNKWDDILLNLKEGKIENPNKLLINGNNLFHIACIRTQTKFIEAVIELCSDNYHNKNIKCKLNPNYLNEENYSGINLYYRYGGTSKKLLGENAVCYLDQNYHGIAEHLIDKIDLLEIYIDTTIKKSCLKDIELVDSTKINYLYHIISKKIKQLEIKIEMENAESKSDDKKTEISRYLNIIKLLITNLADKNAVLYAIMADCETIVYYLMEEKLFDPLVKLQNGANPLTLSTIKKNKTLVEKILNYYDKYYDDKLGILKILIDSYNDRDNDAPNIFGYISKYTYDSNGRSINICIENKSYDILEVLIGYLEKYRKKNKYYEYHRETDQVNSTYLHNFLISLDSSEDISKFKYILSYLIKYTDLNKQNYEGSTPTHIIFKSGVWKVDYIKEMLKGRKMDLMINDFDNNNVYSYISEEDRAEFLELTSSVVFELNSSMSRASNTDLELHISGKLIDVINSGKISKKTFGLFNPSNLNYMLFTLYLSKKHNNIYIPHRYHSANKKSYDMYMLNMTDYDLSDERSLLTNHVMLFISLSYSYSPHIILWYNRYNYYIDPDLVNIMRKHDEYDPEKKHRYVSLKISILYENFNHANSLIYDRVKREAWRFEPYGLTDIVTDGKKLDETIFSLLKSVYDNNSNNNSEKIKYYSPSDYLSDVKFQLVGNEDNSNIKNFGDPGGYCMAWSIWFVDVVCSNPDLEIPYLMTKYITKDRIYEMFNSEKKQEKNLVTNIYLQYIRQYGRMLDDEKNKILLKIGVPEEDLYNSVTKKDNLRKIKNLLKILK